MLPVIEARTDIQGAPTPLPRQGEIFGLGQKSPTGDTLAEKLFSQAGVSFSPPSERTLMSVTLPGMKEGLTIEGNLTTNTRGNLVLTTEGRRKAADLTERILQTTGYDFSLARQQLTGLREERMRIKDQLRGNEIQEGKQIDAAYRQTTDYQAEVLLQRMLSSVQLRIVNAERRKVKEIPVIGTLVTIPQEALPIVEPIIAAAPANPAEGKTAALPPTDTNRLAQTRAVISSEIKASKPPQPEDILREQFIEAEEKRNHSLLGKLETTKDKLVSAGRQVVEKVKSLFQRKENPAVILNERLESQEAIQIETVQPAPQPEKGRSVFARFKNAASRLGNAARKTVDKLAIPALAVSSVSATTALAANLDGYAPFFHQPELTPLMVNLIVHSGMLSILGLHTVLSEGNLGNALRLLPRKVAHYIAAVAGTTAASAILA